MNGPFPGSFETPRPVQLDDVESELFYGSHQGSVQACAQAVAKGADVNVRTKADLDGVGIGATALHVAAFRGHEDVVTALLRAKADAVATTGRGEMPLQLATRMGHVEVVKVLRAAGAAPQHAGLSLLLLKVNWTKTGAIPGKSHFLCLRASETRPRASCSSCLKLQPPGCGLPASLGLGFFRPFCLL